MANSPLPANDNARDSLEFVLGPDGELRLCCEPITVRHPPPREVPDFVVRRLALALGVAAPAHIAFDHQRSERVLLKVIARLLKLRP